VTGREVPTFFIDDMDDGYCFTFFRGFDIALEAPTLSLIEASSVHISCLRARTVDYIGRKSAQQAPT
jgi:hypothetical protein